MADEHTAHVAVAKLCRSLSPAIPLTAYIYIPFAYKYLNRNIHNKRFAKKLLNKI